MPRLASAFPPILGVSPWIYLGTVDIESYRALASAPTYRDRVWLVPQIRSSSIPERYTKIPSPLRRWVYLLCDQYSSTAISKHPIHIQIQTGHKPTKERQSKQNNQSRADRQSSNETTESDSQIWYPKEKQRPEQNILPMHHRWKRKGTKRGRTNSKEHCSLYEKEKQEQEEATRK